MRSSRLYKVLPVILIGLCLSVRAEDKGGWQFDSLDAKPAAGKSDAQVIYELLLGMLDAWNSHDIERYLSVYWHSPDLLFIIDSEEFNGWRQLHDAYEHGYLDPASMGFSTPARIKIRMLRPDLALALTWWSISFPKSKQKVVGNSTMNLQKFEDGWKIISCHSSTAEM
jgi:uncharacterized protein (TIGR02246 family)